MTMTHKFLIDTRLLAILIMLTAAVFALIVYGPIPQPSSYHSFADQRMVCGIPHFGDVISNMLFLAVGSAGMYALRRGVPAGGLVILRPAYLLFFTGSALLFPASAYYHVWPSNVTLVWDRLAIAVIFMAFFSIVIGEYVNPRLGVRFLYPLVVFGLISVVYWRLSDSGNGGDLRLYVLVQFLPLVLIPFIATTYRSFLRPVWYLWALLAFYGLAKVCELLDEPIFGITHFVSGHSFKHIFAAAGIAIFLLGLYRRRREVPESF